MLLKPETDLSDLERFDVHVCLGVAKRMAESGQSLPRCPGYAPPRALDMKIVRNAWKALCRIGVMTGEWREP